MHYLYFTAIKKDKEIKDTETAKEQAQQVLEDNYFSNSEGGYWSASKSDWFVMGGRWSGTLQEIQLKGDWQKRAKELVTKDKPEKERDYITTSDIEKHKDELQALWVKMGGKGTNTWGRDQYNHAGEPDDCMLLDEKLHKALEKEKYTEVEVAVIQDGYVEDEMKMSEFLKEKDIINNYYLAVVDYHN
jgi:hypothetical protein